MLPPCRKLLAIRGSLPRVLQLRGYRSRSRLMGHSQFLRRRPRIDAAAAAVVAHTSSPIILHTVFIHIVKARGNIGHGAIVIEPALIPIPAVVTAARISKSVIDTAVISDVRRPIAGMKQVDAVIISPPWRSPQSADIRRQNPCARNPIIPAACVVPITRGPHVIVARRGCLVVFGQRRWRLRCFHGLSIGRALIVSLAVFRRIGRRSRSIALA